MREAQGQRPATWGSWDRGGATPLTGRCRSRCAAWVRRPLPRSSSDSGQSPAGDQSGQLQLGELRELDCLSTHFLPIIDPQLLLQKHAQPACPPAEFKVEDTVGSDVRQQCRLDSTDLDDLRPLGEDGVHLRLSHGLDVRVAHVHVDDDLARRAKSSLQVGPYIFCNKTQAIDWLVGSECHGTENGKVTLELETYHRRNTCQKKNALKRNLWTNGIYSVSISSKWHLKKKQQKKNSRAGTMESRRHINLTRDEYR